jgi:hypothetical protein
VRRPDPSKQRLWLGADRYSCGCARGRHAIAYTDCDSYSYSYCYSAAGNADTYRYTNATTYRDTDANFIPGIANAYAQGKPKASSDSASSAVKEAVIRFVGRFYETPSDILGRGV